MLVFVCFVQWCVYRMWVLSVTNSDLGNFLTGEASGGTRAEFVVVDDVLVFCFFFSVARRYFKAKGQFKVITNFFFFKDPYPNI